MQDRENGHYLPYHNTTLIKTYFGTKCKHSLSSLKYLINCVPWIILWNDPWWPYSFLFGSNLASWYCSFNSKNKCNRLVCRTRKVYIYPNTILNKTCLKNVSLDFKSLITLFGYSWFKSSRIRGWFYLFYRNMVTMIYIFITRCTFVRWEIKVLNSQIMISQNVIQPVNWYVNDILIALT